LRANVVEDGGDGDGDVRPCASLLLETTGLGSCGVPDSETGEKGFGKWIELPLGDAGGFNNMAMSTMRPSSGLFAREVSASVAVSSASFEWMLGDIGSVEYIRVGLVQGEKSSRAYREIPSKVSIDGGG
jgi:hypothetical protein